MRKPLYLLVFMFVFTGMTAISCKKEGCTDEKATNHNEDARKDDGSCKYVDGCTDPNAINFDADATRNDGSCTYEFIADNSTFSGFANWVEEAMYTGADPASLGDAHGGNDSTSTRTVYFMDGQDASEGKYPRGTLIVKHTKNSSGTLDVITAMAKRGGSFNPAHNDWEWFILNADGSIAQDENGNALRGANLMSGACGACHTGAGTDFVYSK